MPRRRKVKSIDPSSFSGPPRGWACANPMCPFSVHTLVEVCDHFCCKRCEASHFQTKVVSAVEHGRFCEHISGSGLPRAVPAHTCSVRSALSAIMDIPLNEVIQDKMPRRIETQQTGSEHSGGQFCLLCHARADQNHLASSGHVTRMQCKIESTNHAPTLNYNEIMDATETCFSTPPMKYIRNPAETCLALWSPQGPSLEWPPFAPAPPLPPPPPPAAHCKNPVSAASSKGGESVVKWQTSRRSCISGPAKQLALPDPNVIKHMTDSTAQPEENYAFTEREHAILCELTGFLAFRAWQKVHSNT